jgi:hypothetical protein
MAKESLSFKVNGISYSIKGMSGYSPLSFSAGYSSSGGYKGSAGTMRGYSIKQMYPVSLFPVPYGRIPDPLDELLRTYRKKCPKCGKESMGQGYGLN